ncbi:MAG: hypothetical protein H7Y28_12525 [Rhodoferax sp.]|nr:hypothetical protein [Rhodoferax sp.]
MQTLRRFTVLTRFLLVWFVLSLGAAVASPIVKPQDILLVCSASGAMKVLVQADDGSTSELGATAMDCSLCLTTGAPPPVAHSHAESVQPLAYALQSIPSAHIAAATSAPLPARGPPTL